MEQLNNKLVATYAFDDSALFLTKINSNSYRTPIAKNMHEKYAKKFWLELKKKRMKNYIAFRVFEIVIFILSLVG